MNIIRREGVFIDTLTIEIQIVIQSTRCLTMGEKSQIRSQTGISISVICDNLIFFLKAVLFLNRVAGCKDASGQCQHPGSRNCPKVTTTIIMNIMFEVIIIFLKFILGSVYAKRRNFVRETFARW